MREWFQSLQPRERLMLITGAVLLVTTFFYLVVWKPLDQKVQGLRESLASQMANVAWMRTASREVRALQGQGATASVDEQRSLLAIIDQSARGAGLREALERMEPDGSDRIKLWVTQTSFDGLVAWLGELEQRYRVSVSAASFEPLPTPGQVEARLTLERTPS